MSPLLLIVLAVVLGVCAFGALLFLAVRLPGSWGGSIVEPRARWKLVAEQLGLAFDGRGEARSARVCGRLEGVRIEVVFEDERAEDATPWMPVILASAEGPDPTLVALPSGESALTPHVLEAWGDRPGTASGDELQNVSLRGAEAVALADHETRRLLRDVVGRWGGRVRGGQVALPQDATVSVESLVHHTISVARLAGRLLAALQAALPSALDPSYEAALGRLLELGAAPPADLLLEQLRRRIDRGLRLTVRAAGNLPPPVPAALEDALLERLDADDAPLRVEAARALGRAGSVRSVAKLGDLAARTFIDLRVAHAARDAVRAIQSRLQGAEAGQLSLAEGGESGGELSLTDPSVGGEVSLADTAPAADR